MLKYSLSQQIILLACKLFLQNADYSLSIKMTYSPRPKYSLSQLIILLACKLFLQNADYSLTTKFTYSPGLNIPSGSQSFPHPANYSLCMQIILSA